MSAQPILAHPPAPDHDRWLSVEAASALSGKSDGHLRRLCAEKWMAEGKARLDQVPGRRSQWMIRADADAAFAPSRTEAAQFDMNAIGKKERERILKRERIVKAWVDKCSGNPDRTSDFLLPDFLAAVFAAEGVKLSRSTLYNWKREYLADGRQGLLDGRASRLADDNPFAEFYTELRATWLAENQPKVSDCYRAVRILGRRNGWAIPHLRSASRFCSRIGKADVILAREGEKAFDDKCAAHVIRNYTRIIIRGVERPMESNDLWCVDHHACDCLVSYKGKFLRPVLTAFEDIRSRRIMAWRFWAYAPDATCVLLTFRTGVMGNELAIPRFVYADNGKDFDAYILQGMTKLERRRQRIAHDLPTFGGVFGSLQIEVTHALPWNAKAKPVERFFGTYEQQFGKFLPTYTGKDTLSKPEGLYKRLAAAQAPTFEDYCARASAWIATVYNSNEHDGQGMDGQSPDAVYAQNLIHKRTTTSESLNICLQRASRPVVVGRGSGVRWGDKVYGMSDPLLMPYFGQKVILRGDPDDITRVTVWTLDDKLIGELAETRLSPFGVFSWDQTKEAAIKAKRHNKAMKIARQHGLRPIADPLQLMLEERQEQLRASPPPQPDPASMQIVRTPHESQLKSLRAMQPAKKAVGAESFDLVAAMEDTPMGGSERGTEVPSLLRLIGEDC